MPVPADTDSTTKQQQQPTTGGATAPAAPAATPPAPTSASVHNGESKSGSPVSVAENSAARSNGGGPSSSVSPPPPAAPGPVAALTTEQQQPAASSQLAQQDGATSAGAERPQKIFVGGLSWQTSEDTLREIFEQYGEVTECNIMKDPISKRSRGFGFITFKEPESVDKVLNVHTEQPICIDEKTIDPKIAIPPKRLSAKVKRIFVGGLSSDSSEEDLRDYFETFGKVVESQLMYDRNTNRHRGFGFVTFESEEPAEKVCSIQYHDIKGKKVEVKVAQTKEALAMQHGRNKMLSSSRNYSSYSYPASYTQYYPPSHPYSVEMMGYGTAPVLYDSKHRGGKSTYSQFPTFSYAHGGWGDHRMNGVYYAPTGYGGIPLPLLRGHIDSAMIPTSGMDYITDHFQGMALGYPPPSPVGQYAPLTPISMSAGIDLNSSAGGGGSYSPPHNLSPKGGASSTSVNGYNSQVPAYTGGQTAYPVAQASY